jgi:DNA-binding FrmR family transcriptional regulator
MCCHGLWQNEGEFMSHPCHQDKMSRINRIQGQWNGIKKMIDSEKYCVDILTQLRAIESATKSLQREILKTHLEHCVKGAMTSKDKKESQKKVDEVLALLKKW